MKFATKSIDLLCVVFVAFKHICICIWNYPPHLRHVATLPWEIKNSNFLQIWKKTQIAF